MLPRTGCNQGTKGNRNSKKKKDNEKKTERTKNSSYRLYHNSRLKRRGGLERGFTSDDDLGAVLVLSEFAPDYKK